MQALAKLHRAKIAARLRLIGDGPLRAELERQVGELGLAQAVTFTGELPPERVREELARADIFCMASFSEGLPISIMEAMAIGVPVATTWIAGIPELAEHGVTALSVPPADPDALAAAVAKLAQSDELRRSLALAARERVSAQHDLRRSGERVARLLSGEDA